MELLLSRRAVLSIPALASLSSAADSPADRAHRMLSDLRTAQRVPGMSAAVWKGGSVVWSESLGESDLENGARASSGTRFRIGSLSKLFTAAAAVRLNQAGQLDLDAPVQKYVPTFPKKSETITARQLLGHLSGIRHYGPSEYLNRQRYSSVAETLKVIEGESLLHSPGARYLYSSYGFNLLGAILEGAASQDFLTVIRRQVCDPLHLESPAADDNQQIVPGRTRFYSLASGQVVNSPYTDLSDRWPSGGLLSTAEDLVLFGAGHLAGAFLTPESRRLMFTSQRTHDGKETGTGFGWRIGAIANHRIWHHGGDAIGGRAFLLLRPEDSIAVAVVANLTFAKFAESDAMALADLFA